MAENRQVDCVVCLVNHPIRLLLDFTLIIISLHPCPTFHVKDSRVPENSIGYQRKPLIECLVCICVAGGISGTHTEVALQRDSTIHWDLLDGLHHCDTFCEFLTKCENISVLETYTRTRTDLICKVDGACLYISVSSGPKHRSDSM